MKAMKFLGAIVVIAMTVSVSVYRIDHAGRGSTFASPAASSLDISSAHEATKYVLIAPAAQRYILDASQSKFIAHALAGGLLWFKGHDHLVAVRDFSGEARLDPNSIQASSLEIIANTASMQETSSVFTEAQKKIINKELHDLVPMPDQTPDIVFRRTT